MNKLRIIVGEIRIKDTPSDIVLALDLKDKSLFIEVLENAEYSSLNKPKYEFFRIDVQNNIKMLEIREEINNIKISNKLSTIINCTMVGNKLHINTGRIGDELSPGHTITKYDIRTDLDISYDPRQKRPLEINKFLDTAENMIKNSKCLRRNYGAALVNQRGELITTGYNSVPEDGLENCIDKGSCLRAKLNIKHGSNYEICRSIHAEQRCIIHSSFNDSNNGTLFLVGKEYSTGDNIKNIDCCDICKKMILEAGIKFVVFRLDSWGKYKIINTEEWKKII